MRIQPQTMAPGITLRRVPRIDLISTEPHMPHVLMEKGDMTLGEFDQHLKRRTDFIKGMKKDSSAERKVRGTEAESQGWQNQGGIGNLAFTRPVKRQGLSGAVTYSRSHSKLVAAPCQFSSVGPGHCRAEENGLPDAAVTLGCPPASWQVTVS